MTEHATLMEILNLLKDAAQLASNLADDTDPDSPRAAVLTALSERVQSALRQARVTAGEEPAPEPGAKPMQGKIDVCLELVFDDGSAAPVSMSGSFADPSEIRPAMEDLESMAKDFYGDLVGKTIVLSRWLPPECFGKVSDDKPPLAIVRTDDSEIKPAAKPVRTGRFCSVHEAYITGDAERKSVFDSPEEAKAAYPNREPWKGYRVLWNKVGLPPATCRAWHSSLETAIEEMEAFDRKTGKEV